MESLICKKLTVSAYFQTSFASQSTLRGQQRSHCLVNILQSLNVKWLLTDIRATPSDVGGGGVPHFASLSYRILIYRKQVQLFLLYYPAMLFLCDIIYLVQVPLFICRNYLGRSDYFLTNQETEKTFFTSILKGLVALI